MAGAPKQHSKRLRHDETMGEEDERPGKRHHALQQQEAVVEEQSTGVQGLEWVADRLREEARGLQLERPSVKKVAGQRQLVRREALDMGSERQRKEPTRPSHGAGAEHLQKPEVAHGQAAAAVQDNLTDGPIHSLRQSVVRPSESATLTTCTLIFPSLVYRQACPAHRVFLNPKHCHLGWLQAPVSMDQVLLQWEGGNGVQLARVRDGEGCWLGRQEVHTKLESSITIDAWNHHINGGEHTS